MYSRKNTARKSKKTSEKQSVSTPEIFTGAQSFQDNEPQILDQATQEMFNSLLYGYDYTTSLLMTLSSKYCLCEMFAGCQETYPTGFYDSSFSQVEQQSVMERAKQGLSTLEIPKGSFCRPEDQLTPTTMLGSPNTLNMLDNKSWQEYSQKI